MTDFHIGLMSFPVLLVLIALRIPVAAAMMLVGLAGLYLVMDHTRMIDSLLKSLTFGTFSNYSLSIIPLFLLMGEFATRGGMSRTLFSAARAWLGHRKGGLAMAAIGASAGFGAICGSSLATASTMGKVVLPELQRAGYPGSLATGALAAGGTLGILIPPSVVLVVYAILAEENIEKLFTAAFLPGLLAMLGYMLTIAIVVRGRENSTVALPRLSYPARFQALTPALPVLLVFLLVIGGMYSGAFSPTAAAAVGVAATATIAVLKKRLSWQDTKESLLAATQTSAMIFCIILAAGIYNAFLSASLVPQILASYVLDAGINPWLILTLMLLLYLALGTMMDSLAMIFLTVPIFIPIITSLDFGIPAPEVGIWFGILVLMAAEIGLITPPIGLNLFVINAMAKNIAMIETWRGILPFVISDIVRIVLLVVFPSISMVLVRWLF